MKISTNGNGIDGLAKRVAIRKIVSQNRPEKLLFERHFGRKAERSELGVKSYLEIFGNKIKKKKGDRSGSVLGQSKQEERERVNVR